MGEDFLNKLPEESAEELYENAPCGYISFLADGTIFRINTTLLNLLGYEEKQEIVQVKKIQDLFRIGGKIYFETHFFPLVKMQGFVKEINFDLVKQDGNFFPALLNVNQISFPEGNSMIYRASVLDITDRKKYERVLLEGKEKAEAATKAKAEFLSTISHEIRTPLNAIAGIGNLIQNTSLDKLQKEYARILQLSSSNLLELVNNLLDLSKLEADKVKLEERNFSLNQLLDVLHHSFRLRAREKKIDLKFDRPENLPDYLLGDPVKLNQILTNLLGNAIKFTKKGFVALKSEVIERDDKTIVLQFTVFDTGIGIPKDKLNVIFQEFSQASYDVNLEYGGTGLGLTISQKLLQMHGSELAVTSEEGKGSEFSFALKFKLSEETSTERKKERSRLAESLAATGARILVVDDNSVNLFITSQYLQDWKLDHKTVDSGQEAIKAIKEINYDMVLMDLHMPKMDGYETATEIHKIKSEKPPAIIALSASGRGDVSLKMKRAGINAYVPKPFDPTDLQEVMLHFLNNNTTDTSLDKGEFLKEDYVKSTIGTKDIIEVSTPPVSVKKYLKLAKGNPAILEKLINNSLQSIKMLREEFSVSVNDKKGEKLRDLIHKNTMSLHYLEAHRLIQLLEEFQYSLQQKKEEGELQKIKGAIIEELDSILDNLELQKFST